MSGDGAPGTGHRGARPPRDRCPDRGQEQAGDAAARAATKLPNLILIGFMGTGKTSIGRRCAHALGFRFRDSDALIERRAGKPVAAIFSEDGEPAFRSMELAAIRTLARQREIVLATGGGAPMDPRNVAELRASGVVVLLQATAEEIAARCGSRMSRPLLADAESPAARIAELLAHRAPSYRSASDVTVDTTGLRHSDAVERVLDAYRLLASVSRERDERP